MKKLSNLFIAALVIAFAFSSCKKDAKPATADGTSSLKLTSNGAALSFNQCMATTASINGLNHTLIIGTQVTNGKVAASSFEVEIIHDIATIKAGQTYQMETSFSQPEGAALYYFSNDTDYFVTQPGNPQGSVTITGATATTITGTFSGKLFDPSDFSGTTVLYTTTNGSFTAQKNTK